MIKASQGRGRHDSDYVQFDTVRKMRSALSNAYESSALGGSNILMLKGERGKTLSLSCSPSDSKTFKRFILGMESRMGRLVKSNIGLDINILVCILQDYNTELKSKTIS